MKIALPLLALAAFLTIFYSLNYTAEKDPDHEFKERLRDQLVALQETLDAVQDPEKFGDAIARLQILKTEVSDLKTEVLDDAQRKLRDLLGQGTFGEYMVGFGIHLSGKTNLTVLGVDEAISQYAHVKFVTLHSLKTEFENQLTSEEFESVIGSYDGTIANVIRQFPPRFSLDTCSNEELDRFFKSVKPDHAVETYLVVSSFAEVSDHVNAADFLPELARIARQHKNSKYHVLAEIYDGFLEEFKESKREDIVQKARDLMEGAGISGDRQIAYTLKTLNSFPCFIGFRLENATYLQKKYSAFHMSQTFVRFQKALSSGIAAEEALLAIAPYHLDPWGEAYSLVESDGELIQLVSNGEDMTAGTSDDVTITIGE